ncbi:MAG TPA: response regulator transcription factor [Mycobacteriales bacterium]|jgi:DNA-binding NarL/FixJ family response regulator|nr:response regulator transcription factor [Mycobacteriales bacterium]
MTTDDRRVGLLIVDDDESMRDLLRLTFELHPEFEVVAEAGNGADAVTAAATHRPDAVILDVMMPGTDGLEALPKILDASPESKIIVFSAYATVPIVQQALEAGASLVLEKTVPQRDVVAAVLDLVPTR